jgi:hypothetical protein
MVKLRCEMADTLRLRQVLDPRNPQHRALLPAAVAAAAAVPAGAYTSRFRHRWVTVDGTGDEVGGGDVVWRQAAEETQRPHANAPSR